MRTHFPFQPPAAYVSRDDLTAIGAAAVTLKPIGAQIRCRAAQIEILTISYLKAWRPISMSAIGRAKVFGALLDPLRGGLYADPK